MNNHPEGPRTLWTQVRDNLPLTPQAVERGLALERGRHPTLTELRNALGLDLELSGAWDAARRVRLPRDETPSDEQLVRFLDEMYRGLISTRLVRVELSDEGVATTRGAEPIRVRAGERLVVLVLVDNRRHSDGDVAIELLGAHGEVTVEAMRTASVLLDAGVLKEGTDAATLAAECEGSSVKQEIATECASSWTLSARITDDGVDVNTPARVYLKDEVGAVWPQGATVRKDEHGATWTVCSTYWRTPLRLAVMRRGLEIVSGARMGANPRHPAFQAKFGHFEPSRSTRDPPEWMRAKPKLERGTRFELATSCLEGRSSTTELPPLSQLSIATRSSGGRGRPSGTNRVRRVVEGTTDEDGIAEDRLFGDVHPAIAL